MSLFYNNTKEEGIRATEVFPVPASILKLPHCINEILKIGLFASIKQNPNTPAEFSCKHGPADNLILQNKAHV